MVSELRPDDAKCDFALATWNNRLKIIIEYVEEAFPSPGPAMFQLRRIPGTLLLALVACVGMILSATEASACSRNRAEVAAPTCCARQLPSACGCCGPARSSPRLAMELQSDEQAGSRLIPSLPEVPDCQCRPTEPAAASSKPQSRPTEDRPTEACHGTTLPEIASPTVTPVRTSLTTGSLPDLPLYLTNARLLI